MPSIHALIIDDESSNIEVLGMLLANEGVTYTSLMSPKDLEDILKTIEHLNIIFLDLELPNGDGFEMLQALKADPRTNGVPVVAYTVHTSEIDVARQAGFDGFLGKPLQVSEFPEQLRRILAGEQVWAY